MDDGLPAGDPTPGETGPQGEVGASPFSLIGDNAVYTQGNVGIGLEAPAEALHVVGNSRVDGTAFADAFSSNSPLRLQTAGTTRVFVDDTTGAMGIGTENPEADLHIKDTRATAILETTNSTSGSSLITSSQAVNGCPMAVKSSRSIRIR